MANPQTKIDYLIYWIRNTCPPQLGLLVPVSGGTDSALAFWLCTKAFPKKTLGVFSGAKLRQEDWFMKCGRLTKIIIKNSVNPEIIRWSNFLLIALQENRVLVGTRNRSEDILGSYSLASRLATYMPLTGLYKSEVLELCQYIGVPKEIIDSSGRADPLCGRPQELAEIPITLVDVFLKVHEGELPKEELEQLQQNQIDFLNNWIKKYGFKRDLPVKAPR